MQEVQTNNDKKGGLLMTTQPFKLGDLVKVKIPDMQDSDIEVSFVYTVTSFNEISNTLTFEETTTSEHPASLFQLCVTQSHPTTKENQS